ncbi:MAG TPA: hypothetical protein VM165_10090 [Planctomycetaceae bacterium]|nr:hypothetical protein [Planctomycetaceae bacterium]
METGDDDNPKSAVGSDDIEKEANDLVKKELKGVPKGLLDDQSMRHSVTRSPVDPLVFPRVRRTIQGVPGSRPMASRSSL